MPSACEAAGMTSSTAPVWYRVVGSGAALLATAFALPPTLLFVAGALGLGWADTPARAVVDVVALLVMLVGAWRLSAAPVSVLWRVVVVAAVGVALFGAALQIGGPSRFDVLIRWAHWLSYADQAVQAAVALLGWQIERRVRGRGSPLWALVVALQAPPLLAMLAPLTMTMVVVVGAVGVARVVVLAVALARLRALLRRR